MRFVTYQAGSGLTHFGVADGDSVIPLSGKAGLAQSALDLIAGGTEALAAVRRSIAADRTGALPLSAVRLLAPIPRPSKNIYCVGRNYLEHVAEGDRATGKAEGPPSVPIFFSKPPTTVIGTEANIVRHRQTSCLDYEVELGVIIGKAGKDISEADALDYVWGYTVINDVTARDLQDKHKQWFKGKSMDTFCPMGPVMVHASAVPNPHNLNIELRVNGQVRQRANTSQMMFNINRVIAELSAGLTLEPGDIIATGTCSGCAFGMTPPAWLQPGDLVETEVESIGVLRNTVVNG